MFYIIFYLFLFCDLWIFVFLVCRDGSRSRYGHGQESCYKKKKIKFESSQPREERVAGSQPLSNPSRETDTTSSGAQVF